jgi:hypothetical protein
MAERHYVGVYWEDRPATRQEGIEQIGEMLARLRRHDPVFGRWYLKRASREESLLAELTEESQTELLEQELGPVGAESPGLGWKVTVWNGLGEGQSGHADLVIGAHAKIIFSPTPNSCDLQMPRGVEALLRRDRMTALLSELARVWRADWGVASTDGYLYGVMPSRPPHHPRVGWLTFLHGRRGRAPRLANAHVTQVEGLGYVVGTHDEVFTSDDTSATGRVRDMEDALEAAKKLWPLGASPPPEELVEPEEPEPEPAPALRAPAGQGYAAALDVACVVDALASRLPARRADLSESLLRASTALVVAAARSDEQARTVAEMRALLDLAERLFPGVGIDELGRARAALERAAEG